MRAHLRGLKFLMIGMIGKVPSQRLRKTLYKTAGMTVGQNSVVHMGAEIRSPDRIVLGKGVIVGHHAVLDGRNKITVGNNVNFSHGVWIWTAQHDTSDPEFGVVGGPVTIGDYAWLGGRVVVLPNVTIGTGAVVASGAVVTKNVAPWTIVGGVPAKTIGTRPDTMRYQLKPATALI